MKIIQINDNWQISASSNQYTLQKKELCSPKNGGEQYYKWYDNGYHGSMLSALQGYVRHSLDNETSISDIVNKLESIESDIKDFKKEAKK